MITSEKAKQLEQEKADELAAYELAELLLFRLKTTNGGEFFSQDLATELHRALESVSRRLHGLR